VPFEPGAVILNLPSESVVTPVREFLSWTETPIKASSFSSITLPVTVVEEPDLVLTELVVLTWHSTDIGPINNRYVKAHTKKQNNLFIFFS
jgi:hypothetical protein